MVRFTWPIQDSLGITTTSDLFVEVPDTFTLASVFSQMRDYGAVLDPITGGLIKDGYYTVQVTRSTAYKSAPVAGSEVEKTFLANFSQTGSTYKYGVDVPAIASALIVDGRIDLANTDLGAWVAWLTAAHSGLQAVSKFALTLIALVDALISFRKHRKAESRRSIVIP